MPNNPKERKDTNPGSQQKQNQGAPKTNPDTNPKKENPVGGQSGQGKSQQNPNLQNQNPSSRVENDIEGREETQTDEDEVERNRQNSDEINRSYKK